MADTMAAIQTLVCSINDVLSAAAAQILVMVERTLAEYEERDECSKLQIEQQRRILDTLLKPRVTLQRAVISKTTASDYWNSVKTRQGEPLSEGLTNAEDASSKTNPAAGDGGAAGVAAAEAKSPSATTAAVAAPVVQTKERTRDCTALLPPCLSPCHVTIKDFRESSDPPAAVKKKKLFDRSRPNQTKKDAKRDASDSRERQTSSKRDKKTSDRRRNLKSKKKVTDMSKTAAPDASSKASMSSSSTWGGFYSERLRRKEQQDKIASASSTLGTSSRKRYRRPKKASSDDGQPPGESARKADSPSAAASDPFANGSNTVARPATLAALAASGWRGMKVGPVRRRVRVRDHTVLHPSLLSLCHVTIQEIMERSMALAREAGWKRKKFYHTPSFKHSRFRSGQAKSSNDAEVQQHLLQMFEEDSNEEEFLGFSDSDEETALQKDVEDSQPSDWQMPLESAAEVMSPQLSSDLTMDSGILAEHSNVEPGGSKDSQSSSTQGGLYSEGLTSGKQLLPAESPAEVMTPHPSPALIVDFSLLEKYSKTKPGGSKDSQPSSKQGELYSEGLTSTEIKLPVESPAEVMTPQVPPALMIDFSILGKDSNADPRGNQNSQSSATKGELLYSLGLMSLDRKLPAKSPNEVRNQQPSSVLGIDSGILCKDSSAEPGGSKDSRFSSPFTQGDFYFERLRSAEQQPPAESPAEPPVDVPSAPFTRRPSNDKEYHGPRKASHGELSSEGQEDSQSSSTQGGLYSEGLTSAKQRLPEESPAEVMTPGTAGGSRQPSVAKRARGRPWKSAKAKAAAAAAAAALIGQPPVAKRGRGRPRITAEAKAAAPVVKTRESPQDCTLLAPYQMNVSHVTISDFMECRMEDLTRETIMKKLGNLARRASEKKTLYAPLVKRTRLAVQDKEGLEGGVAEGGGSSSSKTEYFGFDDLGKSDSDEERTQEKVSREAAAAIATLNTDFLRKGVVSTEHQGKRPIPVQEEPEPPPQSKEEQKELVKGPEEAGCSALTLPASKSEDYNEHSWTEPLSSPASEHMETQDAGASQPTGESQPLLLRCSESDSDDSDEWEETRASTSTGHVKTRADAEVGGATSRPSESDSDHSASEWEETSEARPALRSRRSQKSDVSNNGSQDTKASKEPPSKTRVSGRSSCTVCGKWFTRKHNMIKHMITIHPGSKPFSCTVCGKSFTEAAHLKNHMLSHTAAFGCTVCDKVFGVKNDLNTHMRTHTSTPFSCTVCNKGFFRKCHLAGHMTTHTGLKRKKRYNR